MNKYAFKQDDIVACICEGAVEIALINILLDGGKLKFGRENLLNEAPLPPKYKNGKHFSSEYLGMNYDKKIRVVLVQDGDEKFKLSKTYLKKIEEPIMYVKTKPEIEMFLIHRLGFYEEFSKSKKKPSLFLQEKLKIKSPKLKSTAYVNKMFDVDTLVDSIEIYHSKASRENKEESMKHLLK